MRKCDRCGKNPSSIIIRKTINGKLYEEFYCTTCANEKGLNAKGSFPNQTPFNLDMGDLVGMIEQFFDPNRSEVNPDPKNNTRTAKNVRRKKGILSDYSINLTDLARNGEIDQIIGRNKEVDRVMHILNRRTKNNPVLIGEPGVGKTAIAEGLAIRIVNGDVPEKLRNKEVISLDISSVTAGTMYRGMFEDRMKKILREVESRNDIILFIDELHMIMGAGSSMESSMDAANILKPYLSRGKIQLIGATTLEEYRKIEKDTALSRRFQPVTVKEPTLEETKKILLGLREHYESYHGVKFSDEIIEYIVKLADRYIPERFMPDKAIDLLDEVGARINLEIDAPVIDEYTKKKLDDLIQKEQEAAEEKNYELAMQYRSERIRINNELQPEYSVTTNDIEKIVEDMTGIPVQQLSEQERTGLSSLEENLSSNVIGQEEAVTAVVKAVKRHRLNIRKKYKPITFLFSGPTGVGKTELTKQLANELFGNKDKVIRFDMSEYMEEHSVSKLIGSPPGYVGHEEAGQLTEKVRRNPYSIILLDEFEKAHPKIQHIFLQVFDDGRLTDSHGKTVDFSNTIIVMTSNLGATQNKSTGFVVDNKRHYIDAIHNHFSPEFINRIDAIVPFNHLEKDHILQIVDLSLIDLIEGLKEKGITLHLNDEAKEFLADKGYDEKFGARPLLRTITSELEDPITDLLISKNDVENIYVSVKETDGKKELSLATTNLSK